MAGTASLLGAGCLPGRTIVWSLVVTQTCANSQQICANSQIRANIQTALEEGAIEHSSRWILKVVVKKWEICTRSVEPLGRAKRL